MNKKILASIVAGTLVVGGLGATQVFAEDTVGDYSPIVERLANRFGLNAEEVHQVFEEDRTERAEDRLEEAVSAGEITEEQKALLEAKHEEMHEKMESIRTSDMTDEEKRDALRALHDEQRAWEEENGIDLGMMGQGERKGFGEMNGSRDGEGSGLGEGNGNKLGMGVH